MDRIVMAEVDEIDDTGVEDIIAEQDILNTAMEYGTPGNAGDPLEILYKFHPETILDYAEKILPQVSIQEVPPLKGDSKHTSQPFLSIFEKTKILGFRSNQLAQGARAYIVVPEHITNTLDIARMELEQRRLPYIIKRPMPDGTFEYWRLSDLMLI
jgi:DNA-directed RNA polymerase I, II, and III subunit RPABC2